MFLDPLMITIAFGLGFAFLRIEMPPLLGFLAAGFVLKALGQTIDESLQSIADTGVTILLFSIGLKLNVASLLRVQIWGVGGAHLIITCVLYGLMVLFLGTFIPLAKGLDIGAVALIGFALSFSSTVFAVKALDEKSEMGSRHGRISVGILIFQDIAAVIFLGSSKGKVPSPWSLSLLLLIPGRWFMLKLMDLIGRGDMFVLFGIMMSLGGSRVFEEVNIKGDAGALIIGVMLGQHERAGELAKALLGFKDLFLVAFFLSIGLGAGPPNLWSVLVAVIFTLLVPLKTFLFVVLLAATRVRLRTALLSAFNLGSYSEFGLIVMQVAVSQKMLPDEWLTVLALTVSFSFLLASPLTHYTHLIDSTITPMLKCLERKSRLEDDLPIDTDDASVLVFGMGRLGRTVYDDLEERHPDLRVLGVDFDEEKVGLCKLAGRHVVVGDAVDHDFWVRLEEEHSNHVKLVVLTLPNYLENIQVAERLQKEKAYTGITLATAAYPSEKKELEEAGFDAVFDITTEAGMALSHNVFDIVSSIIENDLEIQGRLSRVQRPNIFQRTASRFLTRSATNQSGQQSEGREDSHDDDPPIVLSGAAARFARARTMSTLDVLEAARLARQKHNFDGDEFPGVKEDIPPESRYDRANELDGDSNLVGLEHIPSTTFGHRPRGNDESHIGGHHLGELAGGDTSGFLEKSHSTEDELEFEHERVHLPGEESLSSVALEEFFQSTSHSDTTDVFTEQEHPARPPRPSK